MRLKERLQQGDLVIRPEPPPEHVGNGAVDLRLGHTYLITRRPRRAFIDPQSHREDDPSSASQLAALPMQMFEEVRLSRDEPLVIYPGQFVLAATLEYLAMPLDRGGLIQSRSSTGRLGLAAVNAAWVGPGYKGSPTLEITNQGGLPVVVRPGMWLCHIILVDPDDAFGHPSRFHLATRPLIVPGGTSSLFEGIGDE